MNQEEFDRLADLRTLGTYNRDQINDYVTLLKKEEKYLEDKKKEAKKEEPEKEEKKTPVVKKEEPVITFGKSKKGKK